MDPLSTIHIAYPKGSVFYGGQKVHGELIVDMKQYIPFSQIMVECIGKIVTQRQHCFSFCIPLYNTTYVTHEILDISRQYVHGQRRQKLAFSFQLPSHCNQALECGRLGFVRYWCQASVVVSSGITKPGGATSNTLHPLAGQRFTCWRPITVLEALDLNEFDFSRTTTQLTLIHPLHLSWWPLCCSSGDVAVHLQLNKTAFVPGENIYASFDVSNNSSTLVTGVHLMLAQSMVNYTESGGPQPRTRRVSRWQRIKRSISGVSRSLYFTAASESFTRIHIPHGETFSKNRQKLHIPSLPTSSMGPRHLRKAGPCTQKAAQRHPQISSTNGRSTGYQLGPRQAAPTVTVASAQTAEFHSVAKEDLHVSYSVVLVVCFGYSLNDDLLVSIPIWIGTVPELRPVQRGSNASSSGYSGSASTAAPSYVDSAAGCVWLDFDSGDVSEATVRSTRATSSRRQDPRQLVKANQLIPPTQFAPQYVYFPTIDLVNDSGVGEGLQRASSQRKSILKKKTEPAMESEDTRSGSVTPGTEGLSAASSQQSIQMSWLSESSLSTRFETPV